MNTSTAFPATRFRSARSLVLAGLLGATLLTGCGGGGGDDDDGVASIEGAGSDTSASTEASDKDAEQQMLDYAECLRGQGLDVPDPEFDGDGGPQLLRRGEGDGAGPTPEDFDKAREVCGDPPTPPGGGGDRPDQAEFQDAALAFAQCMREQGIDLPDPQFDSAGGGGMLVRQGEGNFDPDDPKMKAAEEKCRPIMEKLEAGDNDDE